MPEANDKDPVVTIILPDDFEVKSLEYDEKTRRVTIRPHPNPSVSIDVFKVLVETPEARIGHRLKMTPYGNISVKVIGKPAKGRPKPKPQAADPDAFTPPQPPADIAGGDA